MGGTAKDIADYLPVPLSEFRPGTVVDFDIYLYLERNQHLLTWCRAGDELSAEFLERYRARGVQSVWVSKKDSDRLQAYLNPPEPESPLEPEFEPAPASEPAPEPDEPKPRTEAGALVVQVLQSELPDSQKALVASQAARTVFAEAGKAQTHEEQRQANAQARQVVQDVLEGLAAQNEALISELWQVSDAEAEFEHGVNVATYSVIFAMAFGRIDGELLSDIALAGLLHDVGLTQVDAATASQAWNTMDEATLSRYSRHVDEGTKILEAHGGPHVTERVRSLINQHHEKFDGTGYPNRLQGFRLDDVAQLVAMADLVDSFCNGRWDGSTRTLRDAFDTLTRLEKARSFPEYFNPDVFSVVSAWLQSDGSSHAIQHANRTVEEKMRKLTSSEAE